MNCEFIAMRSLLRRKKVCGLYSLLSLGIASLNDLSVFGSGSEPKVRGPAAIRGPAFGSNLLTYLLLLALAPPLVFARHVDMLRSMLVTGVCT